MPLVAFICLLLGLIALIEGDSSGGAWCSGLFFGAAVGIAATLIVPHIAWKP